MFIIRNLNATKLRMYFDAKKRKRFWNEDHPNDLQKVFGQNFSPRLKERFSHFGNPISCSWKLNFEGVKTANCHTFCSFVDESTGMTFLNTIRSQCCLTFDDLIGTEVTSPLGTFLLTKNFLVSAPVSARSLFLLCGRKFYSIKKTSIALIKH